MLSGRVASPVLRIEALTLFGERASDGQFEILQEFPLGHKHRAKRAAGRSVAAAFVD